MAGTGNRPARERFDFSLDARQVAGVILGSLGALALAFFLGHVLGQRIAEHPIADAGPVAKDPPPEDRLAAFDSPRGADGEKYKDSFHDLLTSAKPPPDRLPPGPKVQAPAPPTAKVPVPVGVAPPAAVASAAAAPTAATPSPRSTTPAATAAPSTTAAGAAPSPQPAPGPVAKPEQKPPAPAATAAAPAPSAAAAGKAAPAPPALRKGATERGAWVVQVGSTQERFEAERIAARFAGRGARVSVADVPGKGRWYRVRLGPFDTREAADRYLKDLERSTGARGFVASAN